HEIMSRYHAGEEYARDVIEEHLFACGVAIGGFISAIDVDAVIVAAAWALLAMPSSIPLPVGSETALFHRSMRCRLSRRN
ncbi:hypothetical protein V2E39_24345, partial [Chryseobacterium arthrosphaerae]